MIRLKDIAEQAGVSVMTVSKALRDEPDVAASTKSRIRTLADQAGYVPNHAARGLRTTVSVSYVEVFGAEVTDLLREGARVGHSKVSAQRFVMAGEARVPVASLADVERCLATGEAQKRRAATAMNARSSRAHALFILSQACEHPATGVRLASRLFLADLGGS